MIDDPATVTRLIEQMQEQLPIPAFPTKEIVRTLRRGGPSVSVKRALTVQHVFYAGDEAGIVCDVTPARDSKTVMLVSLTHLRIAPDTHSSLPSWPTRSCEWDASPPLIDSYDTITEGSTTLECYWLDYV